MTDTTNIFYVEDDKTLAFVTKDNLHHFGYKVHHFTDGEEAKTQFKKGVYNLCILDIMLPKLDGFELAKYIRSIDAEIPIIFLSAKSQTDDRIQGLEVGADDYLTKPFSIQELKLKVEVFLKRNKFAQNNDEHLLKAGNYALDTDNQLLSNQRHEIKLTKRETKLVALFFQNQNVLLKREYLLLTIWGDDSYFNGRSLDVFVSRIRKYLKNDSDLKIENIRSTGFRLNTND